MSTIVLTPNNPQYSTSGPWSAYAGAWAAGSLTYGVDYSQSIKFDDTTFPNGALFTWSFPSYGGPSGVWSYPCIVYGSTPELINPTVPSTQVANFVNLSTSYSAALTVNSGQLDTIFDIWLTSKPNGDMSTTTYELEIVPQTDWSVSSSELAFVLNDSTLQTADVYVAPGTTLTHIGVVPSSEMLSGTISISDILKSLIWHGVITGQEYISGVEFGPEPGSGSGSLLVNSLSYQWDGTPTIEGTSGNDTFQIGTPGGNDVVGNGGVDTVVYSGLYSQFQIKPSGSEILVVEGNDISTLDYLQGVTFIQFADGTYNVATSTFAPTSASPTVTSLAITGPSIVNGSGDLDAGHVVTLTMGLSEVVNVAGGTPTLTLDDGGTAVYVGGSGSAALIFNYTVAAGQNTSDLTVTGINLNGANIADDAGNSASFSGPLASVGALQIDTTPPGIASTVAWGTGITHDNGDLNAGKTVNITLVLTEVMTLSGGVPSLSLSDGGTAVYNGGSGTHGLNFAYTVAPGQNSPDLAVTALHLNGATVADAAGNVAELSSVVGALPGVLQIDTTPPAAPAITDDTVNPNDTISVTGTAEANSTITLYDDGNAAGKSTTSAGGQWSFTTAALANGLHTLTATATDAAGNTSAPSNSTDPPVGFANPDTASTFENTPVDINVLANDTSGGGPLTLTGVSQGTHGAVAITPALNYAVQISNGEEINAGPVLAYEWNQPWTVMTSLNVAQNPTEAAVIFSNVNSVPYPGYEAWINPTGHLDVRIISNYPSDCIDVQSSVVVTDGTWHDVAVSYDGSGSAFGVKIYVDGVQDTATTILANSLTGSIVSPTDGPLVIGNQTNWPFALNGSLDYFSISNVVRSAAYIAQYSSPGSAPPVDANTALDYNFNEDSGTVAHDLSSNGYAATLSNSSMWTSGPTGPESAMYTPDSGFVGTDAFSYTVSDGTGTATGQVTVTVEPPPVVIQTDGTTTLAEMGTNYFLLATGETSGPELKYNGTAVAAGEFGNWNPIGAVQTASGYDVAWNVTGSNQYTVWSTDSDGNDLSNTPVLTGGSSTLESYEPIFNQDLNGDGVIGAPSTLIQTDGPTSLVQAGNNYFLYPAGGTSGPELTYNGTAVTAGEFANWTPIGAVQTSSGYDVAWEDTASNQYTVWSTDSSGNDLSNTPVLSGQSYTLESYETLFSQDINGDGVIGAPTTLIQTNGSTSLLEAGNNYLLCAAGGTSGPELTYNGTAVTAGEFANWTPIGAVQTSSGYDVAWKDTASNQYTIWSTDSNGNDLSNTAESSGTSVALESYESIFNQDLNGDGVLGVYASTGSTLTVQQPLTGPSTIGTGSTLELAAADSGSVSFAGSTGRLQIDQPSTFAGTVSNFAAQDLIDLPSIAFGQQTTLGFSSSGNGATLSVTDGTHSANIALLGSYMASSFALESDGHSGTAVLTNAVEAAGQSALISLPHG